MAVSTVHKNFVFQKSKGYQGTLGPVHRARVGELWSDDLERPPGPAQRDLRLNLFVFLCEMQDQDQPVPGPFLLQSKAAQRGAEATRDVLKSLVADCGIPEGECIVVLDLLPGRPHGMSRQIQATSSL